MRKTQIVVALLALLGTLIIGSPAQAEVLQLPVTDGTTPATVLIDSIQVNATASNPALVRMDRLRYWVSDWQGVTPTNVGVTTYLICSGESPLANPYHGENIVQTQSIRASIRFLITEPGEYTCSLQARAYSSASVPGMIVSADLSEMRFWTSGAHPMAEMWGGSSDENMNAGDGFLRFSKDFFNLPDESTQLILDTALTNCYGPEANGICDGWQPYGTPGNDVRVYASLLPINSDGTKCDDEQLQISDFPLTDAKHHETFNLTLYGTLPAGCAGWRARVGYRMFNGDATQVHAKNLRPTRLILVP